MRNFTERHNLAPQIQLSEKMNDDSFDALLGVCKKYFINLAHMYPIKKVDSFTGDEYYQFNWEQFYLTMKLGYNSFFDRDGLIELNSKNELHFTLFDLIEFLANNIKDITEKYNHPQYKNYQFITLFDTNNIFEKFQLDINMVFTSANLAYKLSDKKTIEYISDSGDILTEIDSWINKLKDNSLRDLIKDAVEYHKKPNPKDRVVATEKIWDAFERLKTYYTEFDKKTSANKIIDQIGQGNTAHKELVEKEFKELTKIGNGFRIRHHETHINEVLDSYQGASIH